MSIAVSQEQVRSLKEQLSQREFKIGELEIRVKDLFSEAKDLDEKLRIANRNARVLEEENSNFHLRLKSFEKGDEVASFLPHQKEAMQLIQENESLRGSLADAESRARDAGIMNRENDNIYNKQLRSITEECEKMQRERAREIKELENTRHQCAELQRLLDEEQETAKATRDLLEQERERHQQKLDELVGSMKRNDKLLASRDVRTKDGYVKEPVQQTVLKEEVAELEQKLRATQQRLWDKERDYSNLLSSHKKELFARPSSEIGAQADREVFRALKDQVKSLQEEIESLRLERHSSRMVPVIRIDGGESIPMTEIGSVNITPQTSSSKWMDQYNILAKVNEELRDEIDRHKANLLRLQNVSDEKDLRCKELEAQIYTTRNRNTNHSPAPLSSRLSPSGGEQSNVKGHSVDQEAVIPSNKTAELKRRILELEVELRNLKGSQEQKDTINGVRMKELQKQVDELLVENDHMRQGNEARRTVDDGSIPLLTSDTIDGVMRLTKDKRESVEEVMRLLEVSWESDDDSRRQLRRARYHNAAMVNNEAMKDEEIRRLQKIIEDLENRLNDMSKARDEVADLKTSVKDLREATDDLKKRNRALDSENDKLRRQAEDSEKKRDASLQKEERRVDDLSRRMDALKDENEQLKRRLAAQRSAGSQPISPRISGRSPRPSPRRRTPEKTMALSQLSVRSMDEQRRSAVPEGAHLAFTVVELAGVLRNGRPITEPGYIIIKLKSIKEKYKTSVKDLSSVIVFDETFVFYLAQPDQDVITLHVFYKVKGSSREYHIGDACFSMATLYRGIPRQRIAPVVQNPGTKDARRAAQVEVHLQTDDFGKMMDPSDAEIEDEELRFKELVKKFESSAPERLHATDVYMASSELQ